MLFQSVKLSFIHAKYLWPLKKKKAMFVCHGADFDPTCLPGLDPPAMVHWEETNENQYQNPTIKIEI